MAIIKTPTNINTNFSKIIFGLAALACSSQTFAAGFQIQEQNAVNLGTAYSGTAAWAVDASSAFYNPAALTHIKNNQIVVSGALIYAQSDFTATNSNLPTVPGTLVPGPQTDDPGGLSPVPSVHYASRLNDDWVFGLSVSTPFGLVTDYDEAKVMRYVATRSELRTFDISPSLAYKANSWLSLAAGADFMYADAMLEAKTNVLGTITSDGFQKNRANDWGYSWHAGFLVDFNERARVGFNYRGKFNIGAEGTSEQFTPANPVAFSGLSIIKQVNAKVVLPESALLSGYYEFDDHWAVMADIHWTAWSRFRTLRLRFHPLSTTGGDTDTFEHFKDTTRVALGVNYTMDKSWQFRTGLAFDQSPIQDEFRTARIPGNDRWWFGLGASWTCNDFRVDLGYAHLFFKDATLSDGGPFVAQTTMKPAPLTFNLVEGKYDADADILGVQIRYDFV